jgi:anti-sigma-K factor RskA
MAGTRWRTCGAATALVSALALGVRAALAPKQKVPIVIDHRQDDPPPEAITLFFHPEVPEATLVLIR